jgi:hypothetical protein
MLKSIVKKNLLLEESRKKRILAEEKIVKGRLSVLPTNINHISKKQRIYLFGKLFNEIKYMNDKGFSVQIINENLIDTLNQLFNEKGSEFMKTVKNKLVEFLKTKLNLNEIEKDVLERAIGNTEVDEVSRLFSDSKFLAQKISQTYGDDLSSMQTMLDDKGKKDLVKSIENSLLSKLEPIMGMVNSEIKLT